MAEEPRLIIAGGENETSDEHQHELTYQATEEDEEKFFLIYHMHVQPSEADALPQDRRQWLIARFVAQKNMEREMMQQARIAQQVLPNLQGGPGGFPPNLRGK
jgi:hypothetical protein